MQRDLIHTLMRHAESQAEVMSNIRSMKDGDYYLPVPQDTVYFAAAVALEQQEQKLKNMTDEIVFIKGLLDQASSILALSSSPIDKAVHSLLKNTSERLEKCLT